MKINMFLDNLRTENNQKLAFVATKKIIRTSVLIVAERLLWEWSILKI